MTDPIKPRRRRFRFSLRTFFVLLAALSVCFGIAVFFRIKRTPAGFVIASTGTYYSPHAVHRAIITKAKNGQLKLDSEGIDSADGAKWTLTNPPDADWFAVWDARDNLWFFVEGDEVRIVYWKPNEMGVTIAGDGGGWDGIPKSFFDRLPEPQKAICRGYLKQTGQPLP